MQKFRNLKCRKTDNFLFVLELFFIALFTYTALEKLLDFDIWIIKLFKTGFFSLSFSYFLGVGVPIAEFVIVFCLIFQLKFCYQINFFFILVLTLYLIFIIISVCLKIVVAEVYWKDLILFHTCCLISACYFYHPCCCIIRKDRKELL